MAYQIKDEVIADITRVALDGFDTGVSPLRMLEQAWGNEAFSMHCPEHHYLMPAVLLSAARRVKGDCRELLERDLSAAAERARNVLPGFCGWYGACGAAVGSGIFLSLLTDTSPYSEETWGKVNQLTSECLRDIAALGGPRCCKRVCFTALDTTAAFMRTHFGLDIGGWPKIRCAYHSRNAECKGVQCPYHGEEAAGADEAHPDSAFRRTGTCGVRMPTQGDGSGIQDGAADVAHKRGEPRKNG